MGGGDLNLKKSWHPHTIKNQEKVWKAEQAKSQEEKKLNELRTEIEKEKDREELKRIGRDGGGNEGNKKLDWMYKNSTELINREEYLLGRKIDKSFEVLQAEEKEKDQTNLVGIKQPLNHVEHECVPFSIRSYKNLENSDQVDLQRKVLEDPLMLIKQREMESRRKILENPVKLKELHRILKTDDKLRKGSKKSKKSKKSNKKHRKRKMHSSSSSSSSSESDLDSKLAKKLKGGLLSNDDTSNLGLSLNKLLDSKFEKISQELDKAAEKNGRSKKKKEKNNCSDSDSDLSRRESYQQTGDKLRNNHKYNEGYRHSLRNRSLSKDKYIPYQRNDYIRRNRNKCEESNRTSANRSRSRDKSCSHKGNQDKTRNRRTYHESNCSISRNRSRSRSLKGRSSFDFEKTERIETNRLQSGRRDTNRSESSSPSRNWYANKLKRSRSVSRDRKTLDRKKTKSPVQSKRSHQDSRKDKEPKTSSSQRSSNLTYEEKQAKLKEMMSNAAWREKERREVVRKHREANAREEERHKNREFDKNFLNNEVKKAMDNQNSVGGRLRANLNNIQRTSSAMNSNFARK